MVLVAGIGLAAISGAYGTGLMQYVNPGDSITSEVTRCYYEITGNDPARNGKIVVGTGMLSDGSMVTIRTGQSPSEGQPFRFDVVFNTKPVVYDVIAGQNGVVLLDASNHEYDSENPNPEITNPLPSSDHVDITIVFNGHGTVDDPDGRTGPIGEQIVFSNVMGSNAMHHSMQYTITNDSTLTLTGGTVQTQLVRTDTSPETIWDMGESVEIAQLLPGQSREGTAEITTVRMDGTFECRAHVSSPQFDLIQDVIKLQAENADLKAKISNLEIQNSNMKVELSSLTSRVAALEGGTSDPPDPPPEPPPEPDPPEPTEEFIRTDKASYGLGDKIHFNGRTDWSHSDPMYSLDGTTITNGANATTIKLVFYMFDPPNGQSICIAEIPRNFTKTSNQTLSSGCHLDYSPFGMSPRLMEMFEITSNGTFRGNYEAITGDWAPGKGAIEFDHHGVRDKSFWAQFTVD